MWSTDNVTFTFTADDFDRSTETSRQYVDSGLKALELDVEVPIVWVDVLYKTLFKLGVQQQERLKDVANMRKYYNILFYILLRKSEGGETKLFPNPDTVLRLSPSSDPNGVYEDKKQLELLETLTDDLVRFVKVDFVEATRQMGKLIPPVKEEPATQAWNPFSAESPLETARYEFLTKPK